MKGRYKLTTAAVREIHQWAAIPRGQRLRLRKCAKNLAHKFGVCTNTVFSVAKEARP